MKDLYNLILTAKLQKGEGGGDITVEPLSVTSNGTYTAQSGKAYSPVNVAVPQPSGSVNITQNGTADVTNYASAVVNVPSVTPTGNINITSTAQTDVSAYATAQVVDADLVAGNIKKDVNILGVAGTYEGGGGGDDTLAKLIDRSIISLIVPDGVTKIGGNALNGCTKLESITIPEGVTELASNCLKYTKLANVELPSTISILNSGCLASISSLQTVTCKATTPPSLSAGAIDSNVVHIYVPAGSVETYKAASGWSSYASKIQAIPE